MRFIADEMAAVWMRDFVPNPDNFDWDEGNFFKNYKHGISSGEIESIFWQPSFIFAGKIIEPLHDEWRGLILGRTDSGRPNERRLYEKAI